MQDQVEGSQKRVLLASLYLGSGPLEAKLVSPSLPP